MTEHEPFPELRHLHVKGIEFIVVGGVAAALQGAPGQTFDIDVVFRREPEDIKRILRWLEEVDAIFRIQPARRLRPNESHLMGTGHLNLITRFGPVDLLAQVGRNLGFTELLPHSIQMDFGNGISIRVLKLEKNYRD